MKRTLLAEPDPRLRVISEPVQCVDKSLLELIDDMFETMYAYNGIGLAAPQIDVAKRVVVIDLSIARPQDEDIKDGDSPKAFVMINPEIISISEDRSIMEERCLSVMGYSGDVSRPSCVKVRFQDCEQKNQELQAEGLLATCIQHEIDHLNGVLFIDHLSDAKKDMILQKITKSEQQSVNSRGAV